MWENVQLLSLSKHYIPHGHCYLWQPNLIGLHLLSDTLIAVAYYSIPLMLVYFVRQRQDVPFKAVFVLFSAFIVACGTTHLMEVVTLWRPFYWISGSLKAATALISIFTAVELWPVIPQALALPSTATLEAINLSLEQEISRRQAAETALKDLNTTLEQRVADRTAALEAANERQKKLLVQAQQAQEAAELAQQQSQLMEEQFRATFEQAAVGIAHVAPDGTWLRVNQQLCEITGYTDDELRQQTFQDITHPNDLETDLTYVEQLLAGVLSTYTMEKRYFRKDGSIVWIQLTVSLVREPTGTPKYFIAVVEDIGDLKQSQAELQARAEQLQMLNRSLLQTTTLLERKNQELDQFAYVVSHDLKAPLRAIANLATWLEEDLTDVLSSENREYFQLLQGRVLRLEGFITGLLDYSRIGRVNQEIERVDVGDLLTEIIDTLAPSPDFQIVMVSEMPVIQTKRIPLQQVLMNLINNAIKHHDRSHGTVTISYEPQTQMFTVSDDGPGIAPEYHERIFTMFQTLQPKDQLESTGIGLTLVKKLVETEGGSITIDSPGDRGTAFRFHWSHPPS